MISKALLNRLAAKKAGVYRSPFTRRPMWGGESFKVFAYLARWVETPDTWSDLTGASHSLSKLRHTGWFCDANQDVIRFGVVREVRTRNGVRYLACMNDPHNGGKDGSGPCAVEVRPDGTPVWYDDRQEASRSADQMAQFSAEVEREWDEKWTERVRSEDLELDSLRQLRVLRKKARALIAGIRDSVLSPALCSILREDLKNIRKEAAAEWRNVMECRETQIRLKEFVS